MTKIIDTVLLLVIAIWLGALFAKLSALTGVFGI